MADKRTISRGSKEAWIMNGIRLLYYQTEYPANTVCLEAFQALGCVVEVFSCPLANGE